MVKSKKADALEPTSEIEYATKKIAKKATNADLRAGIPTMVTLN